MGQETIPQDEKYALTFLVNYLKSNTLTSKIHICRRQTLNFERAQVDD